jgi:hypothetical protein
MTQSFDNPIRQEHKGRKAHEKAINQIHSAWLRFVFAPQYTGSAVQGATLHNPQESKA